MKSTWSASSLSLLALSALCLLSGGPLRAADPKPEFNANNELVRPEGYREWIFVGASLAWAVLGSSLVARTGQFDGRLEEEVKKLWGGPHRQVAPSAWIERPDVRTEVVENKDERGNVVRSEVTRPFTRSVPVELDSTRATVDLRLEHRQRGLLWYPTYTVAFHGVYVMRNPDAAPRTLQIRLPLPAPDALFDNFVFTIDGRAAGTIGDAEGEVLASTEAAPGAPVS